MSRCIRSTRLWIVVAVSAEAAYATIPGGDGIIHGCFVTGTGQLRLIDEDANQSGRGNRAKPGRPERSRRRSRAARRCAAPTRRADPPTAPTSSPVTRSPSGSRWPRLRRRISSQRERRRPRGTVRPRAHSALPRPERGSRAAHLLSRLRAPLLATAVGGPHVGRGRGLRPLPRPPKRRDPQGRAAAAPASAGAGRAAAHERPHRRVAAAGLRGPAPCARYFREWKRMTLFAKNSTATTIV
jgi:hypothetical protein